MKNLLVLLLLCLCLCNPVNAEEFVRFSWNQYRTKSNSWYRSAQGKVVTENVLSFQDDYGSWPKNIDTSSKPFSGDRKDLHGTFDNGATTDQMRFLAHAFNVTEDARYRASFVKGMDLILKAQYPTGGWPQSYPPGKGYPRHITFNDDSMVRLMKFLREVVSSSDYDFLDSDRREAAQKAFDRGIECILKCQICVDGKLTVWCAQHDEIDYSPRPARSYELVSLSGGESSRILRLLMSLDNPGPEIIKSITAAVDWYRYSKVEGISIKWVDGNKMAVKDANAPTLWGRFYEIETNRPFFCSHDGIPKYDLNQIDQERINGYRWYYDWGKSVFRDYEKWRKRWQYLLVAGGTKILAVIGDSTVCNYPEDNTNRGWGQFIQDYFTYDIMVINNARSGRSTKTFIEEGLWKKTLAEKPYYVLIQFGHNDSHDKSEHKATDADTNYSDYLRQYIDESRGVGAIPVLVTPMHRRTFDSQGKLTDNLLPYANAMKRVGAEKKVAVVDLHTASGELFLKLAEAGSAKLANKPGDRTHFNEKGARKMGKLVMEQLPTVETSTKPYLNNYQE